MEQTMLRKEAQGEALRPVAHTSPANLPQRLRVEGKYFALGVRRLRINGVTYGPFAANAEGDPFPVPERVRIDFGLMQAIGVNAIRTYHVPPEWFLDLADEHGVGVFVDVPWAKHLCFLESNV